MERLNMNNTFRGDNALLESAAVRFEKIEEPA
ncbi:hypothetical protein J2W27_000364 [Variovorax boronicumulans]|nr:hypothetical protein [Variovorax boronicumulans]